VHPAEHRALRELHVFARQLARHWERLGGRLGGEDGALLRAGAADAGALVAELSSAGAERDVHDAPAAAFAGRLVSARPSAPDAALERNQALRFAVLDVQHCVTLLGYLRALALSDGDEALAGLCGRWERRLRDHEDATRAAAVALGERPDEAIAPAHPTAATGRVGQRIGAAIGSVGEWIDREAARRRPRAPDGS
jgi:hypothetical protein